MAVAFGRNVDIQRGQYDEFVSICHGRLVVDNETNSISTAIQIPLIGRYMIAISIALAQNVLN